MNWTPKQTVVVPTDFSDESFSALDTALDMVDQPAGVHLIHVLSEMSSAEPAEIVPTVDHDARRHHTTLALRERLAEAKYDKVQIEVAFGDAGHEISEFADRIGAELVVLPSHGRTGFARLLIGSVAERVVRLAHCPVLVLRRS